MIKKKATRCRIRAASFRAREQLAEQKSSIAVQKDAWLATTSVCYTCWFLFLQLTGRSICLLVQLSHPKLLL